VWLTRHVRQQAWHDLFYELLAAVLPRMLKGPCKNGDAEKSLHHCHMPDKAIDARQEAHHDPIFELLVAHVL